MKKIFFIATTATLVLFACKKETAAEPEPTPTPTPTAVSFATDVQPIFHANCGTGNFCHSTTNAANGKVYETHAGASAVSAARTKGAINHDAGIKNMPQGGAKLSADKISKIEAWIDGGMKND